nr:tRNA pseudouridine(38/39) synthase isoform X1 [Ziziphus jujuba var. spinosa]
MEAVEGASKSAMAKEEGDSALLASLQSLVRSLQLRVKELEAENVKLLSQLTNCCCNEKEKMVDGSAVTVSRPVEKSRESKSSGSNTTKKKVQEKISGYNASIVNYQCKRYVALKIMYFGQRFYGFASEAQMDPTVESEIFGALEKTRLLVGDKKESQYSRCGRTDKGVSSVGQVIALFVRSKLKGTLPNHEKSSEFVSKEQYEGEIDYVRVLNRVLPSDIRVLGWCPVPVGFSARFSCLSREYKYFFWEENLNISAMENAGKRLIGEHDFRNFCKMDAVNVHNYRRHISSFAVSPYDVRFDGNQLWAFEIKGSAFLWHQVRCMVAVLFLIGQGFESPDVIDALLDTTKTPRKPQYIMASEIPLVLQSCEFQDVKFICSSDAGLALRVHLAKECQTFQLQAAIFKEALLSCVPMTNDQSSLNNGKMKKAAHVPLMSRPTEPSYAERRAKLNPAA